MNTVSDNQREQLKKEVIDFLNTGDLTPLNLFSTIYSNVKRTFSESETPLVDPKSWKDITLLLGKYILQNSLSINHSISENKDNYNAELKPIGSAVGLITLKPNVGNPVEVERIKAEVLKNIEDKIDRFVKEEMARPAEKIPEGSLSGEQIYKKVNPSVVSIETKVAIGSGVFFKGNTLIATNRHVVGNASEVIVRFHDSKETSAQVIQSFLDVDLAFIRVTEWPDKLILPTGCESAAEGETVFAIGCPKGLASSITMGTVSSAGRLLRKIKYIQHDAAINGGNSGGPLFNSKGELVGLNTYNWVDSQGMGFAIPIPVINNKYKERREQIDKSRNMRYCPLCGCSTERSVRYCDNCGVDLNRYDKSGINQDRFSAYRAQCSCGCERQNEEKYCRRCGQSFKIQSEEK